MVNAPAIAIALAMIVSASAQPPPHPWQWEEFPPIPDPEGFAAPFAGVSGGALLLAGGANIPGEKWIDGFVKVWHDRVFVLAPESREWQVAGQLPSPLAYGVSITVDDSLLCLGGSDSETHHTTCFRLRWDGTALKTEPLPDLPRACANACGALVGRTVYLAGGLEHPDATQALHAFWALDLDATPLAWKELEPWPAAERMLAVAGSHAGSFYLFSGAKLSAGPDGKAVRNYLSDAWRFAPGQGWAKLPALPRPAVAAASPAPVIDGTLAIFSGDDGTKVNFTPVRNHPGFPTDVLLYDPGAGFWRHRPETSAFSRATVPSVIWNGQVIFPNGEVRPRVRTPTVVGLVQLRPPAQP